MLIAGTYLLTILTALPLLSNAADAGRNHTDYSKLSDEELVKLIKDQEDLVKNGGVPIKERTEWLKKQDDLFREQDNRLFETLRKHGEQVVDPRRLSEMNTKVEQFKNLTLEERYPKRAELYEFVKSCFINN